MPLPPNLLQILQCRRRQRPQPLSYTQLFGSLLSGLCWFPHRPTVTLGGCLLCCLPWWVCPLICTFPPCIKKPRWWPLLGHLSAFNISPRLPIVCDSPVLLPSFDFPHSPEISFSHSPARVPQGWVACRCMLLLTLFSGPIPQKALKTSPRPPCCAPKLLLAAVWGWGRACADRCSGMLSACTVGIISPWVPLPHSPPRRLRSPCDKED